MIEYIFLIECVLLIRYCLLIENVPFDICLYDRICPFDTNVLLIELPFNIISPFTKICSFDRICSFRFITLCAKVHFGV